MEGKLEPTNSPYAMAKLTAIEIGRAIKNEHGIDIINLMPTNLYGPNDNFSRESSHVIPGLIRRMVDAKNSSRKEFSIWGSGKPLREFLYVDDLADACYFLLENYNEQGLVNIGCGTDVSIKELAETIKKIISTDKLLTLSSLILIWVSFIWSLLPEYKSNEDNSLKLKHNLRLDLKTLTYSIVK